PYLFPPWFTQSDCLSGPAGHDQKGNGPQAVPSAFSSPPRAATPLTSTEGPTVKSRCGPYSSPTKHVQGSLRSGVPARRPNAARGHALGMTVPASRSRRRLGKTPPFIDRQIAAVALTKGLPVVGRAFQLSLVVTGASGSVPLACRLMICSSVS